jgi:hypothetical protein
MKTQLIQTWPNKINTEQLKLFLIRGLIWKWWAGDLHSPAIALADVRGAWLQCQSPLPPSRGEGHT